MINSPGAPKDHIPAVPGTGTAVSKNENGDVSAFLTKVNAAPRATHGKPGRLIFAMDATMSRQPTWDGALQIQSQMFAETATIGGLDVQLVYFRGASECRASKWVSTPTALANLMSGIACQGGFTQISRVLSHIKRESGISSVSAAVYVGDTMEEDIDGLRHTASEIGSAGVPIFLFQEGEDETAEHAYREIARLTRGAYFRFDSGAAKLLRDLLTAVAVYAAGGRQALADHSQGTQGAALLLEQLR